MEEDQLFCLRWNNHKNTLFTVFEDLLHREAFTDCRFIGLDGDEIKCHKIVLAACSTHFREIFLSAANESAVIFLPETSTADVRAIINFMYKGEVNVNNEQLPGLIKIATLLKIKGLTQEDPLDLTNDSKRDESENHTSPPNVTTSSFRSGRSSSSGSPPHSNSGLPYKNIYHIYDRQGNRKREPQIDSSWSVLNNPSTYQSIPTFPQSSPSADVPLRSRYENNADLPPIKRKRRPSFSTNNRDTPILRTVLGQNQERATPQSSNLICHSNDYSNLYPNTSDAEFLDKRIKSEPCESERSYPSNLNAAREEAKVKLTTPLSPQYINDLHNFNTSAISYTAPQKTHRYKQYTSTNLQQAIEAVRCGKMSALKAATYFNIPSRTLYDKIKKLGIIRGRPKRSPNGNSTVGTTTALPRRRSGTNSPSDEQLSETEDASVSNHSPYINPLNYLQQGKYEQDCDDNENLTITHKDEVPPNTTANYYMHYNKLASSPVSRADHLSTPMFRNESHSPISRNDRSPLGNERHSRMEPHDNYANTDNDQVEDLSMKKSSTSRVIMSPKSQMSNSILLKEEMLKEAILEESRREVSAEDVK